MDPGSDDGQTIGGNRTRRRLLQALGTGSMAAVAGCEIPIFGDPDITLPPLTNAWADFRGDGTLGLVLQFDGDIQKKLENPLVSKQDLVSEASSEGYSISFQPVSISGIGNIPTRQTVTGVIEDMVTVTSSWPGGIRYEAENGFYFADRAFDVSVGGQSASVRAPVEDPTYTVLFPSGFAYHLPEDHQKGGIFEYSGYAKDRTIPVVSHFDAPVVGRARAFDAYRVTVYKEYFFVTDPKQYRERAMKKLRQAITNLGWEIGKEGAGQFVPSSGFGPSALSDLWSIHSAVTTDLPALEEGLNSFSDWAKATANNPWLGQLSGELNNLYWMAHDDYWTRNPRWTSAVDRGEAKDRLTSYINALQKEIDKTKAILTSDWFGGALPTGYFKTLHTNVDSTLRQFNSELGNRRHELRTIADSL